MSMPHGKSRTREVSPPLRSFRWEKIGGHETCLNQLRIWLQEGKEDRYEV